MACVENNPRGFYGIFNLTQIYELFLAHFNASIWFQIISIRNVFFVQGLIFCPRIFWSQVDSKSIYAYTIFSEFKSNETHRFDSLQDNVPECIPNRYQLKSRGNSRTSRCTWSSCGSQSTTVGRARSFSTVGLYPATTFSSHFGRRLWLAGSSVRAKTSECWRNRNSTQPRSKVPSSTESSFGKCSPIRFCTRFWFSI